MQSAAVATQAVRAPCPECEGAVRFDRPPLRSQVARCTDCGTELEVIDLEPLRLERAPEVEEDWGE